MTFYIYKGVLYFCSAPDFFTAGASAPACSATMLSITFSGPKEQGLITREQQDTLATAVLYSNHHQGAGEVN